ncbi:DUF397 domain-containing protein [Streptomyces sp. 1268]|uniref:DUF397 domain-containing protein n=1 Tax=Streptomyces sp. 1268 TaxID=3231942 RepID=UPI0038D424BB
MIDSSAVTASGKSSASQGGQQECVEVAHTADGGRAVRDSKDPAAGLQFYGPDRWAAPCWPCSSRRPPWFGCWGGGRASPAGCWSRSCWSVG